MSTKRFSHSSRTRCVVNSLILVTGMALSGCGTKAATSDSTNPETHDPLAAGIAFHKQGDLTKAIAAYTDAIRDNKDDFSAFHCRASAHHDDGNYEAAVEDYSQAILLSDAQNVDALFNRGQALNELGRADEAVADFTACLSLDSKLADAYLERGLVHYRADRLPVALQDLNRALELNPEAAEAYQIRGDLMLDQGRFSAALEDFDAAIQSGLQNTEVHIGCGLALYQQGHYTECVQACDNAIKCDPKNAEAFVVRADAHYVLDQPEEALQDYATAIKLNPDDATVYNRRALVFEEQQQIEAAIADYQTAIRLAPEFADALANLAWLRATCSKDAIRDGAKAVELAKRACELTEWLRLDYCDIFAAACAEAGNFEEAAKQMTELIDELQDADAKAEFQAKLALYQNSKAYRQP